MLSESVELMMPESRTGFAVLELNGLLDDALADDGLGDAGDGDAMSFGGDLDLQS